MANVPPDGDKKHHTPSHSSFRGADKVEDVVEFAKKNKADTAAYIILFIGIVTSIFYPLLGGTIVGAIVGVYFADDIIHMGKNLSRFIEKKGIIKSLILAGLLLLLLIALPSLFIAAAIAVAIKQLVQPR